MASENKVVSKKKYCRGCGERLDEEIDGPFWKFDQRCLTCRLVASFAKHGIVYRGEIKEKIDSELGYHQEGR